MPEGGKSDIPLRFILDQHFLEYLFGEETLTKDYLKKLNKIHIHDKGYQWKHNSILDNCFKEVIKNKRIRAAGIIAAMHPIQFWHEEGLYTSVIKQAIAFADKKPFKNCILTGEEHIKNYEKNKHYGPHQKLRDAISIKSEKDALQIIDEVYDNLNN